MGKQPKQIYLIIFSLFFMLVMPLTGVASVKEGTLIGYHAKKEIVDGVRDLPDRMIRFKYDTGLTFEYPDAVRGVYMTAYTAAGYKNYLNYLEDQSTTKLYTSGEKFKKIVESMDKTDLNSVVIDIKDDVGHFTFVPEENSPIFKNSENYIRNPKELLKFLEEKKIYPIARIVAFKDTVLAKQRPDLSFTENGQVWTNGPGQKGDAFINPFLKETWDHNVNAAIEAAKLGFKEIQFDYVRFPEGFERRDDILTYDLGEYKDLDMDNVQKRVQAVTDFVEYAREQLKYYDVDVSVDIFGYTATLPEAPGIGQNFTKISEHVDVISSMIYPSHWTSYFGISRPDLEPYQLVSEYAKVENKKLAELENPPVSRPWIQDFTASYLPRGHWKRYGKPEVEAQIKALNEQGIKEFLLWNASNNYTQNVDYTPLN